MTMVSDGATVFFVMPASASARLFATETSGIVCRQKPQMGRMYTGWSGAASSRSWRVGRRFSA